MNEHDDLDMLAAEFVLGTLDSRERALVEQRRQQEPELEALIELWQQRLAPLGDEVQDIAPGPGLLARIEQRIETLENDTQQPTTSTLEEDNRVVALHKRLRFWQWSTGLTSAAALVLVGVLLAQILQPSTPQSFVAVFQQNDQQPAFMLTVDLESRQLQVQAVTAEPLSGQSYQLWIKEPSLGPKPHSVGVLTDEMRLQSTALQEYDPDLLRNATFGISVEPEGGSPTGQPTGPAIHGYLYSTADEDGQHSL
ncbi:anti-sigma factor domain-containing protein [Halomonas cupida]|uniref:anti-sigma factor n=1 Tax=Halomonas cupida TaxID=44933 RepID=UPI003A94311B